MQNKFVNVELNPVFNKHTHLHTYKHPSKQRYNSFFVSFPSLIVLSKYLHKNIFQTKKQMHLFS